MLSSLRLPQSRRTRHLLGTALVTSRALRTEPRSLAPPQPNGSFAMTNQSTKTLLLIGASRGLGYAIAEEYLKRGWQVVATERESARSKLHDLLPRSGER